MKLTATKSGIRISQKKQRREDFDPEDQEWLDKHTDIEIGEFIGNGRFGNVHSLKNNKDLVIKVPANGNCSGTLPGRCRAVENIEDEASFASMCKRNNEVFFIPTKVVAIKTCKKINGNCIGLIRPRVRIPKPSEFTDDQIEEIRQTLIILTHKGYVLKDGLQFGYDKNNRKLQFDLGKIEYSVPSVAFDWNENAWENFLFQIGKLKGKKSNDYIKCYNKYGKISRRSS